jgi:hypothetical protein
MKDNKEFSLAEWLEENKISINEFSDLTLIHRNTVRLIRDGKSVKNKIFIESFCKLYSKDKEFRNKVKNIENRKK